MKENIDLLNKKFENAPIEEVLKYFLSTYGEKIALASSLGAEDQVLTDLLLKQDAKAKIFTLDTGRLYEQTYKVMDLTNRKYNIKIDVLFPHAKDVETLYQTQGINGFKESIENRKECCHIRKIAPLKRALSTLDVWITGLRRSQSQTRESMKLVEFDEGNNLIKINPLIEWSEEEVWDYLKKHKVPYNELHEQGFPSIGCAPCTRAIAAGEDIRSGRWWWESPEHKECGLHLKNN
ncbi:MAG: phosphoadenylyl-sulfate reductase [Epsilonproteobacteria bacterium]|nr:phosphoadenylyl-sulfate reductase [Campylobacterota bacterium]OIO16061.1 MAG: phosphoadenosine phosphosulfate reductase [Helicobacteraceae bacterium CG1_02_36_14]PIP10227.1 MAG: phosphoadenylyl-sulfate reductase [Sulfurimonas sp. CG23_combo_of_CG06-09_8_20_14_all_36_33]PIS26453.1 MAG: phosphoadenylyl-sulfate reductase [Sulfurimonas sp. CG08_land_8_20_14_0_20_36_33]PIU33915.1 MAG: phosphoadenylyl-sulfate reductase [Sulfurimonas sp. CG07_land_8_20_14_0_80_36_56]PIV03743.1 MAG: phosphoadenylyl